MAPQYVPVSHSYSGTTSSSLVAHSQQPEQLQPQHNPFSFPSYPGGNSNVVVPVFGNNYIRQRPQSTNNMQQNGYTPRTPQQMYVENRYSHHSQSPPVKYEGSSANKATYHAPNTTVPPYQGNDINKSALSAIPLNGTGEEFGTEVDTLMKAIQAKEKTAKPESPLESSRPVVGISRPFNGSSVPPAFELHNSNEERNYSLTQKAFQSHNDNHNHEKGTKKKYECHIGKCTKSFYQKTHLEIHERAHTGEKPYRCTHTGCDRTFSQHGNLRTHLRRHTGERPYSCELCGRTFAQKGNVRAHKVVHSQSKPFVCHLDDCRKEFTQRGNLKSHQNKFHISTIRALTAKFASYQYGDNVTQADRELWEYFANLYKNSNKGIKGRGKDRKVRSSIDATNSSHLPNVNSLGAAKSVAHGRSNMMIGRPGGPRYDMYLSYDADDARSHSGSCSHSSSSSCYGDVPSNSYEEVGKAELAFNDRMY